MMYVGGKARIVGKFAHLVNAFSRGRTLWEPFCGGLNASVAFEARRHVLSDLDPYLVRLVRAILIEDWLPDLNAVSPELYRRYRKNPDPDDPMTAFLGYGCSFSGKFFGGYVNYVYDRHHLRTGRASSAVRSFPTAAAKSLLAARFRLADRETEVEVRDFLDGTRPLGVDVIYADPPYRGTTGYHLGDFDSDRFWEVAREHAAAGVEVFVSEAKVPPGVEVVWSGGKRRFLKSERLGGTLEEVVVHLRRRRRPRFKKLAENSE